MDRFEKIAEVVFGVLLIAGYAGWKMHTEAARAELRAVEEAGIEALIEQYAGGPVPSDAELAELLERYAP